MKKDVPLCINFLTKKTPYKGPSADSEEKHEPVSDIDTAAADGLKVLDPKRPIREADILRCSRGAIRSPHRRWRASLMTPRCRAPAPFERFVNKYWNVERKTI